MFQVTFVAVRQDKEIPFWWESEEATEYNNFVKWIVENRKDLCDEYTAMRNDDEMKYIVIWSLFNQSAWLEISKMIDDHFLPGIPPQTWIPSWKTSRGKYFKNNKHKMLVIIDSEGVRLDSRKVY